MPEIYQFTPRTGFASFTQGFLENLKGFRKLDLEAQAAKRLSSYREKEQELDEGRLEIQRGNLGLREEELNLAKQRAEQQRIEGEVNRKALFDLYSLFQQKNPEVLDSSFWLPHLAQNTPVSKVRSEIDSITKNAAQTEEREAEWQQFFTPADEEIDAKTGEVKSPENVVSMIQPEADDQNNPVLSQAKRAARVLLNQYQMFPILREGKTPQDVELEIMELLQEEYLRANEQYQRALAEQAIQQGIIPVPEPSQNGGPPPDEVLEEVEKIIDDPKLREELMGSKKGGG